MGYGLLAGTNWTHGKDTRAKFNTKLTATKLSEVDKNGRSDFVYEGQLPIV